MTRKWKENPIGHQGRVQTLFCDPTAAFGKVPPAGFRIRMERFPQIRGRVCLLEALFRLFENRSRVRFRGSGVRSVVEIFCRL